jgi:hypothetical protein
MNGAATSSPSSPWRNSGRRARGRIPPPDFDARFTVEMIRSGHVRWRLGGIELKAGDRKEIGVLRLPRR